MSAFDVEKHYRAQPDNLTRDFHHNGSVMLLWTLILFIKYNTNVLCLNLSSQAHLDYG